MKRRKSAFLLLIVIFIAPTSLLHQEAVAQQTGQESKDLVWYASYGSNLNADRFMCYIRGGSPPGASFRNPGARDQNAPGDKRPVLIENFELYFADIPGAEAGWRGAAAFIRHRQQSNVLGRMYLITSKQFNDVVLQENGTRERDKLRDLPALLESINKRRDVSLRQEVPEALYDQVLYLGDQDGHRRCFSQSWVPG